MHAAPIFFAALFVSTSSDVVRANSSAAPAVHHCLNAKGRAVFQDQPCESNGLREAKRKQVKEVPPAALPTRPEQASPQPVVPRVVNSPRTV